MTLPPIADADLPALVVLATATVGYVAFHYGGRASRFLGPSPGDAERLAATLKQRASGFFLLGVLPVLVGTLALGRSLPDLGLGAGDLAGAATFTAAAVAIATPILLLNARGPRFTEHYPELRVAAWTPRVRAANAAGWALYLLGYEAFFRGVLLFELSRWAGPWPAVAITTLAYVLVHLPKNAAETVGTLPAGVIFALAALGTGSIWGPLAAHLFIALATEHLAIRRLRATA